MRSGNDLNILNGTLIFPEAERKGSIGIADGLITQVVENPEDLLPASRIIDAEGMLIFPGLIDSHVHVRAAGFSYREDFSSGSRAAAASGITTIMEMPGTDIPANTAERFRSRLEEVRRDGGVSFAMYGAAGADNLDEISGIAAAGAVGFKTFQMAPVSGRETEFYGMCAETYEDLTAIMERVAPTGLSLTVHCESQEIINSRTAEIRASGRKDLEAFCTSRPPESETASVELVIKAAEKTGCRTVIAHTSTPEAVEMVHKARLRKVPVYVESCAQYLSFDKDQMAPHGVFARMKPPFRDRDRVEKMAALYGEGKIDITGSDHAPHTLEEKIRNGADDIWNTTDGLAGLEMTFPLLLKLVEQGKISYRSIAASASQNTADFFNLSSKGRIEAGRDADIVLISLKDREVCFDRKNLLCKCRDICRIYEGFSTKHTINTVIIHGNVAHSHGKTEVPRGSAKILFPTHK